jgi:hypothetical protein
MKKFAAKGVFPVLSPLELRILHLVTALGLALNE